MRVETSELNSIFTLDVRKGGELFPSPLLGGWRVSAGWGAANSGRPPPPTPPRKGEGKPFVSFRSESDDDICGSEFQKDNACRFFRRR